MLESENTGCNVPKRAEIAYKLRRYRLRFSVQLRELCFLSMRGLYGLKLFFLEAGFEPQTSELSD